MQSCYDTKEKEEAQMFELEWDRYLPNLSPPFAIMHFLAVYAQHPLLLTSPDADS